MEETIKILKQKARESWTGRTGEERAERLEKFVRKMVKEYSDKLGYAESEILNAIEATRDYSAINFYQEANFPSLEGVRVFESQKDFLDTMPSKKFRCPACGGVSTSPYRCDSGLEMEKGKICDWASFGFFRTMGKGARVTIRDSFLAKPFIEEIFMPLDWESLAHQN